MPPASELRALIGGRSQAWRVRGDVLTLVARRSEPAILCCSIQTPLRQVPGGLQAVSIQVPDIHTAIFDIRVMTGTSWTDEHDLYRGRSAEPAPSSAPWDWSRASVHQIHSRHLDERREIQVYLPPDMRPAANLPVVYMSDGLSPELVGVAEALWQSGRIAPFILVGIGSSRQHGAIGCAPQCDGRSREYLIEIPHLPPEESRFDAHARFVLEEVVPLVEGSFPASRQPQDRLTAGYSSGGAWALTMAARYPNVFRRTIAMSVGWLPAAQAASELREGRVFIGGGRLEDRFYERSRLAASNASRAGAEVRLLTPNAGHSIDNWQLLFADALRWHFPTETRD